eukprot:3513643-Pleurochrysis_carterae.AAC.1
MLHSRVDATHQASSFYHNHSFRQGLCIVGSLDVSQRCHTCEKLVMVATAMACVRRRCESERDRVVPEAAPGCGSTDCRADEANATGRSCIQWLSEARRGWRHDRVRLRQDEASAECVRSLQQDRELLSSGTIRDSFMVFNQLCTLCAAGSEHFAKLHELYQRSVCGPTCPLKVTALWSSSDSQKLARANLRIADFASFLAQLDMFDQ